MAAIDKLAAEFAIRYGNELRKSTFLELNAGLEQGELRAELPAPDQLAQYKFWLVRTPLRDGRVRIIVEGWRPALGGIVQHGVSDAFDLFPDGAILEIPKSDEDYCGRV